MSDTASGLGGQETASGISALVDRMRAGVEAAPEIYRPGAFWERLIAANLEMLESEGIANFKLTVSNNYYNWLLTSAHDPLLKRAIANWLRRPTLAPLVNRMDSADGLRTAWPPYTRSLSRRARWGYKFFVGVLWDVARRSDRLGLTDRLAEPEVGNPVRI